jgi:hypothetical protein
MKTKTYIKYSYPGAFFPEESSKLVESRDPLKHAKEAGKSAFAFMYYDIDEIDAVDEFGEKRVIKSPAKNKSGMYYINGTVFTVDGLTKINTDGKYDRLIGNMGPNEWKEVILCQTGNFQPYQKGDDNIITH